ncbi:hypothetical protein MNBD_NITROSPINAE02-1072 [hydrothermal vent metagenome]|uniref:Putative zinc-finger domain-containing protein n=1 Tax=hydrothermal vent metagenome TaxID=652676 RepID=A0A3B1C3B7_9ZZZZ
MDCKEIFDKISDYIDQDLDPGICDEIEEHIKDCEPCIAFLNTLKKSVELFNRSAPAPEDIPSPVSTNLMRFLKDKIEAE